MAASTSKEDFCVVHLYDDENTQLVPMSATRFESFITYTDNWKNIDSEPMKTVALDNFRRFKNMAFEDIREDPPKYHEKCYKRYTNKKYFTSLTKKEVNIYCTSMLGYISVNEAKHGRNKRSCYHF